MENKINIAELLKDCPKGMELDCLMFDNITLDEVRDSNRNYPILINSNVGLIKLTKYGQYFDSADAKCVIFPKGKTTWEGFVPPCQFKDGDIVFTHADCLKVGLGNTWISIFQEKRNGGVATYVDYAENGSDFYAYEDKGLFCMNEDIMRQRLATEEEKQRLFQAIKDNGYKWNETTKTLEKLIVPKFKVGDKIVHKAYKEPPFTITEITDTSYKGGDRYEVLIEQQDNFELAPSKFDISILKPFDKVLVRDDNERCWNCELFDSYRRDMHYHFNGIAACYKQCIPYEGNEHLLGTINNCDDFYKTWE